MCSPLLSKTRISFAEEGSQRLLSREFSWTGRPTKRSACERWWEDVGAVNDFVFSPHAAVQSLNSLNDQIAQFMLSRPWSLSPDEHHFLTREQEGDPLTKSMTLMRHLLMDAQVTIISLFNLITFFIQVTVSICLISSSLFLSVSRELILQKPKPNFKRDKPQDLNTN